MLEKNRITIEKIGEVERLARQYSIEDVKWRVAMFLRRYRGTYRQGEWDAIGGEVDRDFVRMIKREAGELYDYFSHTHCLYANQQGEKIDLRHMGAVLSALFYHSTWRDGKKQSIKKAIAYQLMPETYLNDLAGWAGDLQTLMNEVDNSRERHETYDDFLLMFQDKLGKKKTCFSMSDLYADVDAYNIANLNEYKTLQEAFQWYYEEGYHTRFSDFMGGVSQEQLKKRVSVFTKERFWGQRFPLFIENDAAQDGKIHTYSKEQSQAARDGFVQFVMRRRAEEQG